METKSSKSPWTSAMAIMKGEDCASAAWINRPTDRDSTSQTKATAACPDPLGHLSGFRRRPPKGTPRPAGVGDTGSDFVGFAPPSDHNPLWTAHLRLMDNTSQQC